MRPSPSTIHDLAGQDVSSRCLAELRLRGVEEGPLLLIAPPHDPLEAELKKAGDEPVMRCSMAELISAEAPPTHEFNAAVLVIPLEDVRNPLQMLSAVFGRLKPGGGLLVVMRAIPASIHALLLRTGFHRVWIEPARRHSMGLRHSRTSTRGFIVSAEKDEPRSCPLLSIIVPVYNEKRTFTELMTALLAKTVPGMDREIIIVESASTDGTREDVLRFSGQPEIKVLLEDRPRGKGYAVRHALAQATGDMVIIQDADLEYDLNDYDALLEPLLNYRCMFVLGGRHGRFWKIRTFNRQPFLSGLANLAHILHTWVFINLLYGQRIKDPHTMFKVFRRDCLYGLDFECDHFDFDIELLVKLLRKGFTPREIPVHYKARSFRDGKKIDILREPFRWVRVDLKHCFGPLKRALPEGRIERQRTNDGMPKE
ncbi:MAG: glycosyltransferase family 2 protein [bacterium]